MDERGPQYEPMPCGRCGETHSRVDGCDLMAAALRAAGPQDLNWCASLTADEVSNIASDRDRLASLLWRFVDARQVGAWEDDEVKFYAVAVSGALLDEAADAIGYDEMGG